MRGVFIFPELHSFAENWPGWRGALGTGKAEGNNYPTSWSRDKNVRWRIDLSERGIPRRLCGATRCSSPGHRSERGAPTALFPPRKRPLALAKISGIRHERTDASHESIQLRFAGYRRKHVIVSYASAGVFCYDLEGKELWRRDLGVQEHIWGNAASPVIYQNLCFLNFGPGKRTFLIALNLKDGKTAGNTMRPAAIRALRKRPTRQMGGVLDDANFDRRQTRL